MAFSRLARLASCLPLLSLLSSEQSHADGPVPGSIGWLHGACLASADPGLAPGTEVQLVLLGEPQSTQTAKILGKAGDAATCKPLMPGRSGMAGGKDASYFQVSEWDVAQGDIAIGLTATPPPLIEAGVAKATVDGVSGIVFTQCATSEGLKFNAWAGAPNNGEPLWEGYYGLGYDLEPSCP